MLLAVQGAWADSTYILKLNNGATQEGGTNYFTVDKGGSTPSYASGKGSATYDGFTTDKPLKMESSTTVTFTTTSTSVVTIVQCAQYDTGDAIPVKFDGTTVSDGVTNSSNAIAYTISDVAAGNHTISRGTGEAGLAYVKVIESAWAAPTFSLSGNQLTINNPSGEGTVFYKFSLLKRGDVANNDGAQDGSFTGSSKTITLPYGYYPANWIQARTVDVSSISAGTGNGQTSEIAKYESEIWNNPPEATIVSQVGEVVTITIPAVTSLAGYDESVKSSLSGYTAYANYKQNVITYKQGDAEAVNVNSTTTTVTGLSQLTVWHNIICNVVNSDNTGIDDAWRGSSNEGIVFTPFTAPAVTVASNGVVGMTNYNSNLTYYYTTDGSTPTSSSTVLPYNHTFPAGTYNLKFVGIGTVDGVSVTTPVKELSVTVSSEKPNTPVFNMTGSSNGYGCFHIYQNYYADATYYYTLDGTDPTTSSAQVEWFKALSPGTYTVKLIAVRGGVASDVATWEGTINATESDETAKLEALPGSWKWEPNGTHNFGAQGVRYNKTTVIDLKSSDRTMGYLQLGGLENASYSMEVNSDGELSTSYLKQDAYISFIVPGPGKIHLKLKRPGNNGVYYSYGDVQVQYNGSGQYVQPNTNTAVTKPSASSADCQYAQRIGGTGSIDMDLEKITASGHSRVYIFTAGNSIQIEEIEYIQDLNAWGKMNATGDDISEHKDETKTWIGGDFTDGTYSSTVNGGEDYIRILGSASKTITTDGSQFLFNSDSGDGTGYITFRATTPGKVEITAEGLTDNLPTETPIGDNTNVTIGLWSNYKYLDKNLFSSATAGDKLRVYVTPLTGVYKDDGTEQTDKFIYFKKNWAEFQTGVNAEGNWNPSSKVDASSEGWVEWELTQDRLNEIRNLSSGGVIIQGCAVEFSQFYLVHGGVASAANSQISISSGTTPYNNWLTVGQTSNNVQTIHFYNANINRSVFIGAKSGVKITSIKWTPMIEEVDHTTYPVVTTTTTSWNRDNNFGGFQYDESGNTPIPNTCLNPGTSTVPANSLVIYNRDGSKGYFTESKQLVFTNSSAGSSDPSTADRIVGIKVNGKGVLRVMCASIGPTSRTVRVSTNLADLVNSTITDEEHSATNSAGEPTANDGEHDFVLARNQHNSYHEFYCYYDGQEGVEQMLYIWAEGASYKEFTWMPGETIMSVTGQLNPRGDLTITEAKLNGVSMKSEGQVPRTLEVFPKKDGENYVTQYIDFQATVNTGSVTVSDHNKAPVWTSSQEGRAGRTYNSLILHTANDVTSFSGNQQNTNPATSDAHRVTIATRKITAGVAKTVDNLTLAALPEVTMPAFGIAYVVAGTTEGDQSDYRRLSLAGPASQITLDKSSILMVAGYSASLTAMPRAYYPDIDEQDASGNYGKLMPIKVADAGSTEWKVYKKNGETYTESSDITVSTNSLSNSDQDVNVTLTAAAGASGTYRIYSYIPGFSLDKAVNGVFERQWQVAYADIEIKPEGIYLKRIEPDGEVLEPTNVSVATPIVYEVISTSVPISDNDLPIDVTPYNTDGTLNNKWKVENIPNKVVVKDGKTYLVYDLVDALQKQSAAQSTPYQHLQYDTRHNASFVTTGSKYSYLNGYDGSTESESHKAYNFNFVTEPDLLGTELETFIYNVSQRDKENVTTDVAKHHLLSSHVWTNDWVDTESWYCNKRSYITLSDPGFSTDYDGTVLYAAENSEITISPYNTALGDGDIKEKIKSIEINFNETTGEKAGNIVTFAGEGQTATANSIKAETGYTVYWEPTKAIRNASIKFLQAVTIDQIKIVYYSAHRNEGKAVKGFSSYSASSFDNNLRTGINLTDDDGNSHLKMEFRQKNTRHFSILQHYTRGSEGSLNQGEAEGDPINEFNSLVIKGDKTEPCEFYIYNNENDNVAEITSIEFVYEKDNTNAAVNIFCTSDPRYHPGITEAKFVNMVGYPLQQEEFNPSVDAIGLSATDTYSTKGFGKLVYRPESPVNFAAFSLDCNEPGYIYVRKIIVRYDKDSRTDKNKYLLASPTGASFKPSANITSIGLQTSGIEVMVPADNNKAVAFTVKRTSTQNNLSSEVVMDQTRGAITGDYQKIVLDKLIGGVNAPFRHAKHYTVRMLDYDRMVIRQVGFRIKDSDAPTIKLNGNENEELRSEEPLAATNVITITTDDKDSHAPENTIVVWTKDGSAPSVEFSADGRNVKSIHGYVAKSSVTFDNVAVNALLAENPSQSDIQNTIVLKALALALKYEVPSAIESDTYLDHDESSSVVTAINGLSSGESTYGETSTITRANYIKVDANTFYTTARRGNNNDAIGTFRTENVSVQEDNSSTTWKALYGNSDTGITGNEFKTFRGGYPTEITDKITMTFGGYELYHDPEMSGSSPDTRRADGFRRNILKNEYWRTATNDLTPYRGVAGVIGGDAYIVNDVHPLHEKATYTSYTGISDASELGELTTSGNGLRIFNGQFDYKSFVGKDKSYYRTWQLPCYGDYLRFEPQQNGKLTVYVKQQGVLDQKDDGTFDDMPLRYRPVFILDEAGKTPANTKATTISKVSGQWNTAMHTGVNYSKYLNSGATTNLWKMCRAWMEKNLVEKNENGGDYALDGTGAFVRDDYGKKVLNIMFGDQSGKSQGVMNMYGKQQDGVAPADYSYEDVTYSDAEYTDNIEGAETYRNALLGDTRVATDDANGFVIISEGYVKYEFDVRAGKTYFVFAANGNLGFCSYTFDEDNTGDNAIVETDYIVGGNDDSGMTALLGQQKKTVRSVQLDRTFKNNTWAALVLPFSVSMHQLRKQFGDGVRVAHFNDIARIDNIEYTDLVTGEQKVGSVDIISIRRHVHQMLVAGVPVFIRPSFPNKGKYEEFTPTFTNVTVEATSVVEDVETNTSDYVQHLEGTPSSHYDEFKCTGSFTKKSGAIKTGDIYMTADEGKFALRTYPTAVDVNGTRCWLTSSSGSSAKLNLVSFRSSDDGIGDVGNLAYITGVENVYVENDDTIGKVYNLKGQLIRNNVDNLNSLPKGVYIINGVKQIVK